MIREVKYTVTKESTIPANKQWLGMQKEDNATEIRFDVSNMPNYGEYRWRIDFNQVSAGFSPGISVEGVNTVSRLLPYDMTRFGGDVQITLVGTKDGEIVYSIPVKGYLTGVAQSEESEGKTAEDISAAEYAARKAAERSEEAAVKAMQAADGAKESEVLTENARRILEEGTEFVFLGGDAKGAAEVDLAVDDTLSEHGKNPVEGQAVFAKFEHINNELKAYVAAQIEAVRESIYKSALLDAHPIGSIYISNDSTDPATLFGGKWTRIKDTFILASGDKVFGDGKAEVTLTTANMPAHAHKLTDETITTPGGTTGPKYQFTANKHWGTDSVKRFKADSGTEFLVMGSSVAADDWTGDDIYAFGQTTKEGNGEAFSIMPPYITRYVWQREE